MPHGTICNLVVTLAAPNISPGRKSWKDLCRILQYIFKFLLFWHRTLSKSDKFLSCCIFGHFDIGQMVCKHENHLPNNV